MRVYVLWSGPVLRDLHGREVKMFIVFIVHMMAAELIKGGNKRFVVLGLGGDGGVC